MKRSDMWKVIVAKFDTQGNKVEERVSFHVNDEVATDALMAASEAAMEYEVNDVFIEEK